MTPNTVTTIIRRMIEREGDYVDHPSDKGGPTRWGITEAAARDHGYTGEMRHLPVELAEQIYLAKYWQGPRFDQVSQRSVAIAEELLDSGVLSGPARAAEWLQVALTRLNMRGKLYPDLKPDGVTGPVTLSALGAYLTARRTQDGERVLLRALNCLQGHFMMIDAIDHREQNEDFLFGWLAHRVKI